MKNMGGVGDGDKTENFGNRERDRKWKCQRKTNKFKIAGSHSIVFKK
jgi:hypothetical protein